MHSRSSCCCKQVLVGSGSGRLPAKKEEVCGRSADRARESENRCTHFACKQDLYNQINCLIVLPHQSTHGLGHSFSKRQRDTPPTLLPHPRVGLPSLLRRPTFYRALHMLSLSPGSRSSFPFLCSALSPSSKRYHNNDTGYFGCLSKNIY